MIDVEKAKNIYREENPDAILKEYGEAEGIGIHFVEVFPSIDDTFLAIDENYKIVSFFITPTNHAEVPAYKKTKNCFDETEEKKLREAIKNYEKRHGEGTFCKEVVNCKDIETFISSLKA